MQLDGVEVPSLLSDPGRTGRPARHRRARVDLPPPDRPRRGHARAVAQADRRHRRPQVRARLPTASHPAHDRRCGHHAGHRHRRGAAHLHGDRRRRARRRRAGDREPRAAGLRLALQRAEHGPLARAGRAGRARGPGAADRLSKAANDILARQTTTVDLQRVRRQCPRRAAPRPDHQLPLHRDDPVALGRRARRRRRRRPRSGVRGVSAAVPARPCSPRGSWGSSSVSWRLRLPGTPPSQRASACSSASRSASCSGAGCGPCSRKRSARSRRPTVPVWSIAVAALAALVLANIAAALPGRRAARTAAALVLNQE